MGWADELLLHSVIEVFLLVLEVMSWKEQWLVRRWAVIMQVGMELE